MEVELRALHSVGSSGGTCPKGRVFESIEQEIKLDLSTLTEILEDITDLRKIESVISDSKNLSVDQWVHTYGMGVETPTYYDHLTGLEGARQSTPAPLTLMLPREKVAQCPYIIAFYDSYVDVEKGSVCLVLEHMGGGSLQDLIDGMRRPSEADVAVVAYSVLRALDELNTKKLLHRDIKPSNILIKGDGAVKLSDFGITFELDCDHAPQTFTGTMCYMSPERIRGEEYGKAGDIWSLGISLVVFITGKSPFAEVKGFWNILDSFQKGAPSTAMRGTSDCSPELNEFLDMCLVRDPELRPDTTMLLQSRFIQKATREGTIQPFQQPKLSGLRSNVTSISKIHATVTAVVNWLPEHLNDMVFLTPSTNLDSIYINIDNSASPISVSKTPRPFTASSDAPMSNQSRITAHMITVSSKAVDRLAFLLGSTFSDVIRIIISHHPAACLRNRAQYVNGTGNEDEKDYKKKYFSNSISMSLSTPTKRCNPLFPYICQDGLHSSL